MKLRTQILLFFFLFALAPLLMAVVINLPLVLERMELFYHKAHMQNLRADFRDLDQHLASRNEMVRLLAKLPEPGAVLGMAENDSDETIDLARTRYIQWMNQILREQQDIVQIVFLDQNGQERFWLDRDINTQEWAPSIQRPSPPPKDFIQAALQVEAGQVLVSKISLDSAAGAVDPRRFMTLRLVSPIGKIDNSPAIGLVLISIDVGGMARYYRNTLWVHDDGSFLEHPDPSAPTGSAFSQYPGLGAIFGEGKPALWHGKTGQIMWVPMFPTEHSGALWVGRPVDPSPIDEFRNALSLRVLSIVFILVIFTLMASRWLAKRADRFSHELTNGIQNILEDKDRVAFVWKGPQELKQLGENLTRLAAEHGRNIRNLRAHARELEESNRYKSQFLANVSHELRTPLNSILLLSKLMADENSGLSAEQATQAKVINEAGKDLQTLIDNILDLSRIEARQTQLNLASIDIPQMLVELLELVRPQFAAKGIPLRLDIAGDAPHQVLSDPDKVRQILKNFLSNALKFTHHGEVLVALEPLEQTPECDCELCISVRDSGIGIPAEKHEQIFDAFKQADGSTNRRYGGTGLGLTISRQLAELLGGKIELKSREGAGSTFSLLLPIEFDPRELAEGAVVIEPLSEEAEEEETPPVPVTRLGDHHVLIVDCDVNNLLRLTPLLEGWGLRVTAAEDAHEAIELHEDGEDFALLLIDIMMPCEDGCDTIRRFKAHAKLGKLPMVALMEAVDAATLSYCRDAGMDAYLKKPIVAEDLLNIIRQHLPGPSKSE